MKTRRSLEMLTTLLLVAASVGMTAASPVPSADEIVRRSIAHHDPHGVWRQGTVQLKIVVTYSEELAEKRGRKTKALELTLAPGRGVFGYASGAGDERVVARIDGETRSLTVGGRSEIGDEERERLRIRPVEFYRDYYEYLYGMPMKLRDPGARIDPGVERVSFEGRDALALRVTYDPEVGSDIWTFFFDPSSFAIVGYRFQKDAVGTIGETIVLGGEAQSRGFRVPRTQAWYVLADGEYLATDEITEIDAGR